MYCILQLVLNDGRLKLNISVANLQLNIGNDLNDGAWHDVRLLVQDGSVTNDDAQSLTCSLRTSSHSKIVT